MDDFTQTLVHYKIALVFIWLVFIFLLEILAPIVSRLRNPSRILNNFGLWALNSAMSLVIIIPLANWATEHSIPWRPSIMNNWIFVILDIIFLDALIYWWHRANHQINFLWRFHEIHHLDQFLDVTTSIRFHFAEVFLSSCFRIAIIILFDIPISSVILFEALLLMASGFHHSNIKLPKPYDNLLSLILVTPSIHGVHHHAKNEDTNSNYSTILSCWDKVFTSRSLTPRLSNLPIGVENEKDTVLLELIRRPFTKKR